MNVAMTPRSAGERSLLAILILLVALSSALPVLRLMAEGFGWSGHPSINPLVAALTSPATWIAARNSLETAVGGMVVAGTLGTLGALLVSLTDFRARRAFAFCFVLPLMIAPQVTALSWLQVTGPASPLLKMIGLAPLMGTRNPLYSRGGIILLLGIQYAPLVFLTLRAGLRGLPRELIEAAQAAGARPPTVLRTIVLPLMMPVLIAGLALAFVSSIGNFGIPALLGIPGKYVVLPTLIYQRLSGLGPSALAEVAILSMLVGLIAAGGIALQEFLLRRGDYRIGGAVLPARPFKLGRWRRAAEICAWGYAALVVVPPLAGLVMTSLVPAYGVPLNRATATLANYAYVLGEHAAVRRAFVNSTSLALAAALLITTVSVPLAYFVVWRKSRLLGWLSVAAELPYALPGVVLAVALILLLLKPVPLLGLALYNTVWIILIAYAARFLVLGLRPLIGSIRLIDRGLEEAAQIAGSGLIRRIVDIVTPMVAPAAAAGALLVFMTAFNELTVSALLWSSGTETLGVVLFSFEQAGESSYASAVGALTVAVTLAMMLASLAFARRLPPGVLPWRD